MKWKNIAVVDIDYWTCSATRLVAEQVPQNAPRFAAFSGSCSETEVSEQLYSPGYAAAANALLSKGIKPKDALHIACAIEAGCSYFITTEKNS